MKHIKKMLLAIIVVFIAIQFIQPEHNKSSQLLPSDITKNCSVPDSVMDILKNACFDCHSDNTRYPWYADIQPVAWLMSYHIRTGKENLNFSEFGAYSHRKQVNKLRAIDSSVNSGSMPLWSYNLIHTNARLTYREQILIINWARKTKDSLTQN